ncbi:YtxH domain-containing protein [Holzapfeliella floricola]|nr:YtxH domain-containing protein [Holzapfeliella floricola]
MSTGKFIFGFLVGAATGFAASAMVSDETKNELAKKGQDLKEKASDYATQASEQFSDYANQAKDKAEELKATSQDKFEDMKDKYDQSTDALKDQIKRRTNQNDNSEITDFDDIVIDGKQAFNEAKDSSKKMINDIDREIKK